MSFSSSFRDRPRLSDRIRGKSGDELFKELRKELDQERGSSSFDNRWGSPTGSAFPRAGFPFDDPIVRGRTDIKSHLEDLAHRHPEFAEHLRYPAWGNGDSWSHKNREPEEHQHTANPQPPPPVNEQGAARPKPSEEEPEEPGPLRGRTKESLSNTVPDMGQKQDGEDKEYRGQRSWSAPPDNRTQPDKPRFVSKIEIQPVNPDAVKPSDATKPPMAPPKPQPQQHQPPPPPQPKQSQSNVRHIPIFVEGRDEPVLPKKVVEPEFTQTQAPPNQHFPHPPSQEFNAPHHFQPQYEQNQQFEQHQQQPHPMDQQSDHLPPEPPVNPRDPLYRVSCVQKEVDDLKAQVDEFNGTSRSDKQYILLDELLTRNLIKLDDIETEGKEEIRSARKNAIKCIQRCISVLENKIPSPGGEVEKGSDIAEDSALAELPEDSLKMDVEGQSTNAVPSEGKEEVVQSGQPAVKSE